MVTVNSHMCPQNHPCPAVRSCPVDAIYQEDIYSAPKIDEEKCISCGECTLACRVFKCDDC